MAAFVAARPSSYSCWEVDPAEFFRRPSRSGPRRKTDQNPLRPLPAGFEQPPVIPARLSLRPAPWGREGGRE
jgi:hypothetical protein